VSRSDAVRVIFLMFFLPVLAFAQGAREEKLNSDIRSIATLTTTDTLDLKDLSKPGITPRADQQKKLGAGKNLVGDISPKPEENSRAEALQSEVIGTVARAAYSGEPVMEASVASTGDPKLDELTAAAAAKYGLDQRLLIAVMRQESSFKPRAISHKGARGLMQLMPATAQRFGVRDIFDPAQNIDGGAQYLRFLLDTFDGDLALALAGYNAGENAVARYGNRVPPYRETRDYVQRISAHYQRLTNGAGTGMRRNQMPEVAERRSEPELIGGVRTLSQY
jgi:hypothetical protein